MEFSVGRRRWGVMALRMGLRGAGVSTPVLIAAVLAGAGLLPRAVLAKPGPTVARAAPSPGREAAVASMMDKAAQSPTALRVFLRAMPKGGDLHNHLSGAIWAEDYLRWAQEAGFCTTPDGLGVAPPPAQGCAPERRIDHRDGQESPGYARLVDSFSTRGWQAGVGREQRSGHGQFFQTFARFAPIANLSTGPMLASVRRHAALNRVGYLELDHNTNAFSRAIMEAGDGAMEPSDIAAVFEADRGLIAPLLPLASAELTRDEAAATKELQCARPQAEAGCQVRVHYLFQALRALPPRMVFRSLVAAFMMADHDPRFVGINIVMPEDHPLALRDYALHMAMIRFLAARYPLVRRTLHAGELGAAQVPPTDRADHIAQAIAAGAQRIGHGVDIAGEDKAEATMARMAHDGIAVEINLTSNDVILGIRGADHPLGLYRRHGVPFVLSTDDAGVLRSDMTAEYVRAVREQGLTYRDLKQASRNSLIYSFMPSDEKAAALAALDREWDAFERDRMAARTGP